MLCRPRMVQVSVLASALLIGCGARPSPPGPDERGAERSEAIQVDRAQVVGFFPDVSEAEVEADQGTQSALEHFGYALEDTEKCLRPSGIPVRAVYANEIVFEDDGRRTVLDLRELSNESVGCAFVAPTREPKFVRATAGPSSLMLLCPAAASLYFSAPECCPKGWKCCPDGNVVGAEHPCPG